MKNAQTMSNAEQYIMDKVNELAAPGTFTARMFHQAQLVESVLATFAYLFSGREYDAAGLVGRLYAQRFPMR